METTGEIYSFSKNRKSINVNGLWLHSFNPLKEDITKNKQYKITYQTKKIDNKEFHNIKSIEPIEPKAIPLNVPQETKESVKPKFISDTTINCILMQSVQYSKDNAIDLDSATKKVIKNYKEIISSI